MRLHFLGANRQVTGSRYLLEAAGRRVLIDCGLFQERAFRGRNWEPFPVDPQSIDHVLLTHAHLDHVGLIPKLVTSGYGGRILTTGPSVDLAKLVLLDSARLQEEDAAYKRKRHQREGRKGRYEEVPLYTVEDAEKALPRFDAAPYADAIALGPGLTARFHDAGHILGSAMLEIQAQENGQAKRVVFSGDIGRWRVPLIPDPSTFDQADYVVMESTYGDREHEGTQQALDLLAEAVAHTVEAGGNLVIPTFAIERAQELLFYFSRLLRQKRMPRVPVFLDSPMGIGATAVFHKYPQYLDAETQDLLAKGDDPLDFPGLHLSRTADQSKTINQIRGTCIILSGSGMCTGGRIKHHLAHNISRPESTILFVGYQAQDTLGRLIVDGIKEVRILGQYYPVRAKVMQVHGLSAHADRSDLLQWVEALAQPPRAVFLTHGEERSAMSLAQEIHRRRGCETTVPTYGQSLALE